MKAAVAAGALLLAGCGPWVGSVSRLQVLETTTPGTKIENHVHTRHDYDGFCFDDEDVGEIPPGISYETDGVVRNDYKDSVRIDYEIRVASWVEPGVYTFAVKYNFFDLFWPWRDVVRVTYRITVVAPPPEEDGELALRIGQEVSPEDEEVPVEIILE